MSIKYYPSDRSRFGNDNSLWVYLAPQTITYQNSSLSRTSGGIQATPANEDTFAFLLPIEFGFTQNHQWDAFDTVEGKVIDVGAKGGRAIQAAGGVRGQGSRADMPITYTDSPRREYSFNFELGSEGDNKRDVFDPVQKLLEMSSADPLGAINYKFPYVFTVKTKTGTGKEINLVNIKYAALTSVQPSFTGPYVNGYPTTCKFSITVTDLSPLFRSSYTIGYAKVTSS
ncbi:MAG TPA: hypothetical protein VK982_02640 [Bacteroidales bacterium]|jgi:hypothetical protein|nr:hypothetical protein [Bacteroidales bacterium]